MPFFYLRLEKKILKIFKRCFKIILIIYYNPTKQQTDIYDNSDFIEKKENSVCKFELFSFLYHH